MNEEVCTHYPHYPTRRIHRLDGLWDFALLEDAGDPRNLKTSQIQYPHRLPVPSAFDAYPRFAGKRGTGVYRRYLRVTPGTRGVLKFGGMGMWAAVFVDDELVNVCKLPYSGFELELPPSEKTVRELIVIIDNRFDNIRSPLQEEFFDFYAYGGIFRHVEWHEVPEICITRAFVETMDLESARIRVTLHLQGENLPEKVELKIQVDEGEPRTLEDMECEEGKIVFEGSLKNSEPWTPSSPVLHQIRLVYGDDMIVERFGLRTIAAKGGHVLLNGKPIKLLGCCRHEAHPSYGPALPWGQIVQDVQILKDLGCNFVRGSHYPQDQRFLDLCDEMGLMVFEESLGWQPKEEHFTEPNFCDLCEDQTKLMVRNSCNHPSVIMWGFLNEGESHRPSSRDLYRRLVKTIREIDPTRLVTYAGNHPFEDINLDLVDVISVNTYPGWYAEDRNNQRPLEEIPRKLKELMAFLDDRGYADKPILISEIGAGAIPGWHDTYRLHWSEEYQSDHLACVCQEITKAERLSGVALWQFCDCRTHAGARALGRPRTFNNKGLLDEFRRPKMAFETVRKAFRNHWHAKKPAVPGSAVPATVAAPKKSSEIRQLTEPFPYTPRITKS